MLLLIHSHIYRSTHTHKHSLHDNGGDVDENEVALPFHIHNMHEEITRVYIFYCKFDISLFRVKKKVKIDSCYGGSENEALVKMGKRIEK